MFCDGECNSTKGINQKFRWFPFFKHFRRCLKRGLHGRVHSVGGVTEEPLMTAERWSSEKPEVARAATDKHQRVCSEGMARWPPTRSYYTLANSTNATYDEPEFIAMEDWLDEHTDFVHDYFIRKATRSMIDSWLVSHAAPLSCSSSSAPDITYLQATSRSSTTSGASTPVRKISAHEFERGGLLKPIVNTIDGTPTFLSLSPTRDPETRHHTMPSARSRRRSRQELKHLDEKELIFELVKDICNELDVRSLCHKILQNVGTLLQADRCSLFLVQGDRPVCATTSCTTYCHSSKSSHYSCTTTTTSTNRQAEAEIINVEIPPKIDIVRVQPIGCISEEALGSSPSPSLSNTKRTPSPSLSISSAVVGSPNCPTPPSFSSTANDMVPNCVAPPSRSNSANDLEFPPPWETFHTSSTHLKTRHTTSGNNNGCHAKCLVSKLFDVCSQSTLQEMEQKKEIKIPWGTGIVGYVAQSGVPVNIPDAYKDNRFNHDIDARTGYKTQSLLCMPIKDFNGEVIGVAQVINKKGESCFSANDEKIFASYLQFCGIGLRNAQLYEKSQLEVKRNQVLLDLARMIFEEQSTIEHMVYRILTHTQSLIQCQRVQVLLLNKASEGSFSRVFDFEASDAKPDTEEARNSPCESRFPVNIGITGYVASRGETVNILNAYEDERFDPSVDAGTTFQHRTILCMPIKNSSGQIIGVIQLVNKFENLPFTKNDENFVEAFAIFCGMGIHNTHMYEKAIIAMAKQSVTLDVLSYHASASVEDAMKLKSYRIPSAAKLQLHNFSFDDIHMDDDGTLKACLRMFIDLDFVERFRIDYEVLCRWLLSVKKNYRQVTYHNWRHAFNVAQMMFAIITSTQWWKIFGEIECLGLMIACLCHDLDHRGTNNSFQIKASSPLAQLYSTSTMEHHHFDQCIMILNSEGNQILSNISPDEYARIVKVLEDAILSTDLAVYFRKRAAFLELVETKTYDWHKEDHRESLRAMTMTVCDLAAITKPWPIEKRVAELVTMEFFEQGDIERNKFNITPIDIMNREKVDELPNMQIVFIDTICLPIYEAFAVLSDKLVPLIEGVRNNREEWSKRVKRSDEPAQV